MRYDSEHKSRTREHVLNTAARRMREKGPHGIGVAEVMAEAGLTHGGFYAHFKSKDQLLDAVIDQMFRDSPSAILEGRDKADSSEVLSDFLDYYLSPDHRDTRSAGCPLPFLAADAPRLPAGLSLKLSAGIARMKDLVEGHLARTGSPAPDAVALSCVSEVIGAVILSRAEPEPSRSDAILIASWLSVRKRLGLRIKP